MCGNKNQIKNKFLMVATVASMIGQFNMDNIYILLDMGYEVHVACNFKDLSVWTEERINKFRCELSELGVKQIQIEFARTPYDFPKLLKSYRTLRRIIKSEQYEGLHCHTPVAGMIARIAALNTKTKVIYTAHGFHFYKGAPIKNWLVFYPVEKICSYMTDTLITINKEDYKLARKKMHAKNTEYVPGVGIDSRKFNICFKTGQIREKLGIPQDAKLILSVGELNENKNHESVIRALADIPEVKAGKIYYAIAGQGVFENRLKNVIKELGLVGKVILLGFRSNVAELYDAADIYAFPSFREGLSVALMEAMASGLPVVCSKIRGNTDLIDDPSGGYLFSPDNIQDIRNKTQQMLNLSYEELRMKGNYNFEKIKKFDKAVVECEINKLYTRTFRGVE